LDLSPTEVLLLKAQYLPVLAALAIPCEIIEPLLLASSKSFRRSQEFTQRSDTPEVADSLEWTFVEDRTSLDGASTSSLCERFNKSAAEAIRTEQLRAKARFEQKQSSIVFI